MIQYYRSTGYYVHDCENGLQPPITGSGVYTSFFNQCDADGKAYYLAIANALQLRESNPCLTDPTGIVTTTTTTTTTTAPPGIPASGNILFDWTGDFQGEDSAFYDIVAWGNSQGYLSGQTYASNQYFSYLSANDIGGYPVVLAVMKGSGLLTGFGNNTYNQLDIPANLTGVVQVSVGQDHVLVLKNDGTVTGFGRDNWGALNFNSTLSGFIVKKVCAGIGSSVFLLDSGIITGTSTIAGGVPVTYPATSRSGFLNIDYYASHIIALDSGGFLTGIGSNYFGESDVKDLEGISRFCAGYNSNFLVYNDGYVSGYGYHLSASNVPDISNSGINIQLRRYLGTILQKDQDIVQWNSRNLYVTPQPEYLDNNVVAISQALNFTAAIFKRVCDTGDPIITGYNFLWKVTSVGGGSGYGGIDVNDLYPPLGTVVQTCNCASFDLPQITAVGTVYTESGVSSCTSYGETHDISFISIRSQNPILNINYTITGYAPKTGFAATGISTGDYWNPKQSGDLSNTPLYYADGSLSPISGGFFETSGGGISFAHSDNMYATAISGGLYPLIIVFNNFETGYYSGLFYGHGPTTGQHSRFIISENGHVVTDKYTSSGTGFISSEFSGDNQYVSAKFFIDRTGDYLLVNCIGFINGIQLIKL